MHPCPSCHQIDNVQKVTAIVSSGTTTGTVTYYESATYQTSTALAQRLMLPPKPTVDRPGGCSMILLIFSAGLALLVIGIDILAIALRQFSLDEGWQHIVVIVVAGLIALITYSSRRSGAARAIENEHRLAVWHHMQA